MFATGAAGSNWVLAMAVTAIALVLAPPVKQAIQNALDRAFYRDRYDYRRALVGFARDLNTDLDLNRLANRLVSRVMETLLVDRMALMLADETAPHFAAVRASGFDNRPLPVLPRGTSIGARLDAGHTVALDDPIAAGRIAAEDVEFWRDEGLYYFIPCVSNEGTIALLALGRKNSGEPLHSEDMALLSAVAGQIATALENARLYRQLHVKATELDRLRCIQREHSRVAGRRPARSRPGGSDRLVEQGPRAAVRRAACLGGGPAAPRRLRRPGGRSDLRRPARHARTEPSCRASRSPAAATKAIARSSSMRPWCRCGPLATKPRRRSGSIVILEDITRRVELEEQLQISEKMASIGLLAAGVAHEVNTPLTGISSFTQMLLEGADPQDPRTRLLEKIERQTFRAAKIVNGLLNLSRPPSATASDLSPVDLNAVINDVLSLLEHQFELQHIKVRRELAAEPLMVLGFEHKLQQVFLNLFLNAKDAMPKGGWLSVTTSLKDGRPAVELADTGSGIPSEYLARIYDPFFTTKSIGHGTGLGLSITYGIVREHHGLDRLRERGRAGHPFRPRISAAAGRADRARRSLLAGTSCAATLPSWSSTTKRSCGRSSTRC